MSFWLWLNSFGHEDAGALAFGLIPIENIKNDRNWPQMLLSVNTTGMRKRDKNCPKVLFLVVTFI